MPSSGRLFFEQRKFSTINIRKQIDIVIFYLSVIYFQFHFPPFVCFHTMSDLRTETSSKSKFSTYS